MEKQPHHPRGGSPWAGQLLLFLILILLPAYHEGVGGRLSSRPGSEIEGREEELVNRRWHFQPPPREVIDFLLEGLKPRTRSLYRREWAKFAGAVEAEKFWSGLDETQRDYAISKYLVDGFKKRQRGEDVLSKTEAGYLTAYLRYAEPSRRYPLSHRVLGVWRVREPPTSACPPTLELAEGVAGGFLQLGAPMGAIVVMLCFRCLLRISEGL